METIPNSSLDFAKQLNDMVAAAVSQDRLNRIFDPYQSECTNELDASLSKAQGEYKTIANNRMNPFFKSEYADFNAIMSTVLPILSKNGLCLRQFTKSDDSGGTTLHTRLSHSSGQWCESRCRIVPAKNDDQAWASTITYKKRHQAMALLGITIDRDASDDDAEENMKPVRINDLRGTAVNHTYTPSDQTYETINAHERDQLASALAGWPDIAKSILSSYKIGSLADLPRAKYAHVIKQVRSNIDQRKSGSTPTD